MTDNSAILMINAIVNKDHMAELPDYLGGIMQVFGKNGGKPVGRYKTVEQLSGDASPEMISIVSFPDADTIKNMVDGADFKALADLRARVFSKLNLMICEGL